jgi:putative heme-binding domain-containing protein
VARIKGREKTLAAIIEPNAEVLPDYRACIAQTTTGENCVGIKTEDGLEGITLRQPQGRSTVLPRLNLRYVGTRDWSLMPVGIEQGLSKQDMADLLEYIMVAPR